MSNHAAALRALHDALLTSGLDYSDVLLDAAAEIERLRGVVTEYSNQMTGHALPEIERLREWNRQMVEKAADGGRLDGYRELTMKLAEKDDEIDQLRQECAALRDEVELKQAALAGTSRMMGEEIERLRSQLAATERGYKSFRDTAEAEFRSLCNRLKISVDYADGIPAGYGEDEIDRQQAEIERLRGLLRELLDNNWLPDSWPGSNARLVRERVREALGEQ